MRAAVVDEAGRLQVQDLPRPEPRGAEVVLRVRYCGVGQADAEQAASAAVGSVLGHEIVGEIAALGPDVGVHTSHFAVGQRVVSESSLPCSDCDACREGRFRSCVDGWRPLGAAAPGGFAEFVRSHAGALAPVPDALTDQDAVLAAPAATALRAVRLSQLSPGDACVVIGAGSIGALVLQAARMASPQRVDVVEPVAARRERAIALGADTAIAPADDLPATLHAHTPYGPDVVFECSGAAGALQAAATIIRPGGRVVMVGRYAGEDAIETMRWILREIDLIGMQGEGDRFPQAIAAIADGSLGGPGIGTQTVALSELDGVLQAWPASQSSHKILVQPTQA